MILSEPSKTPYDFSFGFLGFHVRVHPGFFVLPLVFGAGSASAVDNPGVLFLVYILVLFVSILVHELGHAIAFRFYGVPSRIVLYWMGGLAIPESSSWSQPARLTPQQQIVVSIAGPAAGFVLAALTIGAVFALGGSLEFGWSGIFPLVIPNMLETSIASNEALNNLLFSSLFFNLIWGAFNLMPVLPLDGGQVSRELCMLSDYQNGMRKALMISVVVGGIIAFSGFATQDNFVGILFGILAISSWMTLQQMYGRGQGRW